MHLPIKLLTVALVLTTATFAWFGWLVLDANRDTKVFMNRLSQIEELRGVIVHLDEVLTMSARMAAATGDPRWEERYRLFEPQLDAAIKETARIGDSSFNIKPATRRDAANIKLVEMENRAFAFVRADRKEEAQAVFSSPEYETQKRIYADGITSFANQIRHEFDKALREDERLDLILLIVALVAGGTSFVAWWSAARGVRQWRAQSLDSFHRHEEAEENLRQAHAELEARVQERTVELAKANEALQAENTERNRAEAELQWKTAFLEAQVNSSIDGILVADQEGKKLLQNQQTADLLGIPRHIADDKDDEKQVLWLRGMTKNPELFTEKFVHLFSHPNEISRDEIELKDGTVLDRYTSPVFGKEGKYYGRIWTFRDITERKRAEKRIVDELNFSRTVLEASPLGIITYTAEGDAVSVNSAAAQVVGATVESLEAQNFRNIESWKRGGIFPAADQALKTGQPQNLEAHFVTSFGKAVWLSCRFVPFHHQDRVHLLCVFSDITERKLSEAELEKVHKELLEASRQAGMAEIATNVLHNVGNVLNSVNISTGLIVESVKKSRASGLARVVALLQEHAHDLGAFITNDARGKHLPAHLAQLSEHLLADQAAIVSELDSLRRNVEHIKEIVAMQQSYATFGGVKEMINVVSLVEDSLRMNEGALSHHGVEVIREFEAVPTLNLEKHKILQILVNLLRNALYACDESDRADKRLTVRVANDAGRVRISVMDNGVGIPAENLTRIFSHGFTTRKGGHGFGLHSGALAAKEMGGSLTVHSAGLGQGAEFTLELPAMTQTGKNL